LTKPSASVSAQHGATDPTALHQHFLTILPVVQRHGQVYFRHLNAEAKEEAIAEMVALSWCWFLRLIDQEKDASEFPTAIATYAAKAVNSGRRLCGQQKAKDVLSRRAQRRHGFVVEALPASGSRSFESIYGLVHGQQEIDAYEERLRDNSQTPPPDAAAFRLDFPHFLDTLTRRDRQLAMFLSLGHSAKQAAAKFGLSQGRVTQIRQRLCKEWYALHGETAPFEERTAGTH
jgi:hypothetical protein